MLNYMNLDIKNESDKIVVNYDVDIITFGDDIIINNSGEGRI